MPPVKHDNAITKLGDDGRYIHTFRQSWLNTYMDCPERARREAYGLTVRTENDAACVGTAFHAAVETAVNDLGHNGLRYGPEYMVMEFDYQWDLLQTELEAAGTPIQWVKRNERQARRYGHRMAERFATYTLPILDPWATEVSFGPIVIHQDEQRIIQITGSADYIDKQLGIIDWKSAGREYVAWEKRRWAIQPTFYVLGMNHRWHQGMVSPYDGSLYDGPHDTFTYAVYPDRLNPPEPQMLALQRPAKWNHWLVDQLQPIAEQLEATEAKFLTVWPKRDQHALCSAKWCPAWEDCKGKHVNIGA